MRLTINYILLFISRPAGLLCSPQLAHKERATCGVQRGTSGSTTAHPRHGLPERAVVPLGLTFHTEVNSLRFRVGQPAKEERVRSQGVQLRTPPAPQQHSMWCIRWLQLQIWQTAVPTYRHMSHHATGKIHCIDRNWHQNYTQEYSCRRYTQANIYTLYTYT